MTLENYNVRVLKLVRQKRVVQVAVLQYFILFCLTGGGGVSHRSVIKVTLLTKQLFFPFFLPAMHLLNHFKT